MSFVTYDTLSNNAKKQIDKMVHIWISYLDESLIGIYLHGSMALNCFVEGVSDVDTLIITSRKINCNERLLIAKEILDIDYQPSPFEMSAIWLDDLIPWQYPTPCQFHYSDYWTEHYIKMLRGEIEANFLINEDFKDADIACHVKLTNQSGICIYGKPINEVFPCVPEEDFWQSISADIDEYDFASYNPRYFASNILILGRILSYKTEKRILSKFDAGLWTKNIVPEKLRYIIDDAIETWFFKGEVKEYKSEDLKELKAFLIAEIHS